MMARWDSTVQLLTSMKFTITHVQRAPVKAKKEVHHLLSRFSAVIGLIDPDYFTAKQKKFQSVKENSQRVNVSSGACITL